jgi:two-component system, OmpR family, response regulator
MAHVLPGSGAPVPRVMVVDDDPDIRQLVVELLRLSGYDATSAPSGVEALALLARSTDERPDLVLLDVQMPDLDGWDTLRAIRRRSELAATPVILCTVKAGPADVELGWTLGCDGYLAKPFAIAEMLHEVRRVLDMHYARERAGA